MPSDKYLIKGRVQEQAELDKKLFLSEYEFKLGLGQLEKSKVTGKHYERLPDGSIKVF